jgi:RNA polymerase sigma factor (sigma-70 family)
METRHSSAVLSLVRSICASSISHEPDQRLLHLFQKNQDQNAFRVLVTRHQGAVLALARRIVFNEQDAEDVTQAVFLVLACKVQQAQKASSLTSWLLGVAYRTAKEARRRHARRQRLERPVPLDESIPDRNGSAENSAELRDLLAVLHVELARLPKKYREPFVLCHLEAKSRAEAAQLMGYAIPTLDRRLARARAILTRRIQRATGCDEAIAISSMLTANALVTKGRGDASPKQVEQTVQTALLGASGMAAKASVNANAWALAHWFLHENAHRAFRVIVLVMLSLAGAGLVAGYGVKRTSIPAQA